MKQKSLIATTDAARELVAELFDELHSQSEEAEHLSLELIRSGLARLKLELVLAGDEPSMRLLLEPTEDEGDAVELAASHPSIPTQEGVFARQWFFCRLSHWNPRQ